MRRRVIRLPRNRKRYWRSRARANERAIRAVERRQRQVRVSPAVRLGRIVFFAVLGLLVLVRLGDAGLGYAKPAIGCRVTSVIDGDTVGLVCSGQGAVRGRLLGFDTPEVYSPNCAAEYARGVAATQRLRWEIWTAGEVKTVGLREDRYGRRLVTLFLDGRDAADIMVDAGLARRYAGGNRQGWCE